MAKSSIWKASSRFKTIKELPEWRVRKNTGQFIDTITHRKRRVIVYEIYTTEPIKGSSYTKADGNNIYYYVGTLSHNGKLFATCLGKEVPFFGTNIKQAVRYLFLKTQTPIR